LGSVRDEKRRDETRRDETRQEETRRDEKRGEETRQTMTWIGKEKRTTKESPMRAMAVRAFAG
jgi:hypothetical protein